MKNDPAPLYPDYRSAFCARHRCKPASFERKVFRKGLPFHAKIFTLFCGGMTHPRFQHDLEAIRNIGDATCLDDFNRALDELCSLNELERDWTRIYLGLRVSTRRLQYEFAPIAGYVKREELESASDQQAAVPVAAGAAGNVSTRYRSAEVSAQKLRKGLRVHSALTSGRELDEILDDERMTRRELDEIVGEFGRMRPELSWLQVYLRERDELEQLRDSLRRSPAMTLA